MRLITTPKILRMFYPSFLWEMPKGEKKLYITFDDGPHPTITPQVLEILKKFNDNNIPISVFLLGDKWHNNIENYNNFSKLYPFTSFIFIFAFKASISAIVLYVL